MAHVALGHLEEGALVHQTIGDEDYEVLQLSQQREHAADRLGLELQVHALPDSTQLVTGVSSAIYFLHAVALRNGRLMLLNRLVDERSWKIAHTHPPELVRVASLMADAEQLRHDFGAGLQQVHESLCGLDMQVWDAANRQQAEVTTRVRKLVDAEVARCVETRSDGPPCSAPRTVRMVLRQFDRSPVGVLHALELPEPDATVAPAAQHRPYRELIVEELSAALPPEFQYFRALSRQERAKAIA